MILRPANIAELSNLLSCANTQGEKISSVDLTALNRVLEHKAEDMTATVEARMTLADFQKQLSSLGQWLPIDPPHSEKLSIGDLLSANFSGPRRFGYGTVGDYLIGLKVVLADGRVISPGGKVVKNVAGYDLAKLFIGSRGSLGVIVEATFKLRPIPESESFVAKKCESLHEADASIEAVLNSELTPVVLDLHNVSSANSITIVLGFAGTREEVEWQLVMAREIGFLGSTGHRPVPSGDPPLGTEKTPKLFRKPISNFSASPIPSGQWPDGTGGSPVLPIRNSSLGLDYESQFWADAEPVHHLSVLPSRIIETIRTLKGAPFVARAGNGIVCYRTAGLQPALDVESRKAGCKPALRVLMQRLKQEFDPKNILPELPL